MHDRCIALAVSVLRRSHRQSDHRSMLLSMTGHGEAHQRTADCAIAVEVRTINNRYFKLTVRCGDNYAALESQIEETVRKRIRRGSIQVNLRIDRPTGTDDYSINETVLSAYRTQLERMHERLHISEPVRLETLLALPGVVSERRADDDAAQRDWPAIEQVLNAALVNLDRMRREEGINMARDLTANCRSIAERLAEVERLAPLTVEGYRTRLSEKLAKFLAENSVPVQAGDLLREVGIFADRIDVSEEVVRLKSHLEQFEAFMNESESTGRKLDFLVQEMFREINTIGSKSNDAAIARQVVEMKTSVERIREMIQNVE